MLASVNLDGADLQDINLRAADLRHASLRGSNLTRAILAGANLIGSDLRNANLSGADLRAAKLSDNQGRSADLAEASLIGARLTEPGHGPPWGFLDLATARGLETANFGDPAFLPSYITEAMAYVHQNARTESQLTGFLQRAISNIKLLRHLYENDQSSASIISAVHAITTELIAYLAKHPEMLHDIRPRKFEELIAEILASYGWEVQLTPETKDGGYDLFAISRDISGVKTSWIIECKKWRRDRPVGIGVVRQLYGTKVKLEVANMMLATTSFFSQQVHKEQLSRYDLELRDYEAILEWINAYKPHRDGRLYLKNGKIAPPGSH